MLTYDTPTYMFNVYENQLSRQTGSRNLVGPKTLPTRVSSFKIVSGDAVDQSTWPLLLKIEHMVKLQVFG
jgi:hypothetical protein